MRSRSLRSPTLPALLALAAGLAAAAAALSGCAGPPPRLTVLAATSLTDVMPRVADAYRRSGGGEVTFSFAASSRLAKQVEAGVEADVFVSADRPWMDHLEARGLIAPGTRVDLLGNSLVLVVPRDAAAPPGSAADLAAAPVGHLALAGENVPAGRYAHAALRALGAWDAVAGRVVRGDDVRTALAWVAAGQADAAVVYATDARSEPRVRVAFAFPPSSHPEIAYPAAVLAASRRPAEAAAFVAFCRGPEASAAFRDAGFAVPAAPAATEEVP